MLLACLPRNEFSAWIKTHQLPRLTPHTITDSKTLRTLVTEARGQDWCVARQEHELGVFALAVPLRNMRGVTVAALNVVTTPERLELPAMQRELLPLLLDAARELRPLLEKIKARRSRDQLEHLHAGFAHSGRWFQAMVFLHVGGADSPKVNMQVNFSAKLNLRLNF
eukprot:gene52352-63995_t